MDEAAKTGSTHVGDDWHALVAHPAFDITIECAGSPIAAIDYAVATFRNWKHLINVAVEADAFLVSHWRLKPRRLESSIRWRMATRPH